MAPSASIEELMILKSILLAKIAPRMTIVLWDFPDMPGESVWAVTSDALQAAITLAMGLLYLSWRRF